MQFCGFSSTRERGVFSILFSSRENDGLGRDVHIYQSQLFDSNVERQEDIRKW